MNWFSDIPDHLLSNDISDITNIVQESPFA